jgi:hypothetical protein
MIPTTPVPQIATDSTWVSGVEVGQPTRVAVPLAAQKQGILPDVTIPAANINALLGPLSDHVVALSEVSVRNWTNIPTTGVVSTGTLPVDGIYAGIYVGPSLASNASIMYVIGSNNLATAPVMARARIGGIDWTSFSSMPGTTFLRKLVGNGSFLVGVGTCGGNTLYSTDTGTTWTAVATHNGNNYSSVCELSGVFYAINGSYAANGVVAKSVGNVAWTATATVTGAAALTSIRSGGGSLLCWGGSGSAGRTYVSLNGGATWTAGLSPVFASLNAVVDIQYSAGAGVWLAISNRFEVAISPDGINWTLVKAAQFGSNITPTLATDGSGVWVVAYSLLDANNLPGACVAYSLDGITWKNYSLRDVACPVSSVVYSALHDCFFVMLHDGVKAPQIWRSLSTGTAWALVA